MFDSINGFYINLYSEYSYKGHHNVISEDMQGSGKHILEKEQAIHYDVDYKRKNVKVHLSFSEEETGKNAQYFYDSLKNLYMGKVTSGLSTPDKQR